MQHVPVAHPKPDAKESIDILMGRADGSRPPLVEHSVDEVVMRPIVTELLGRRWADPSGDRRAEREYLDNFIEFWYRMGYDFVRIERGLTFTEKKLFAADTARGAARQREWADEHRAAIGTWADFEDYTWPRLEDVDFFALEYVNAHLPEGMGLVTCHAAGIYEHLSFIMSYEQLCYAVHDDPALVKAVSGKVGELITGYYERLLELENVVAIFPGDDLGFRTGTLIAPDDLRKYVLPWHKRWAAMAHERGVPYFLHSCGQLEAVMEDLISDVRIDGKHSFEDAIIPIERFQERYGDRIAVLGGIDVNVLASATPEDVRRLTRYLSETCGSRGRYAIGSGNSIPSYVPVANYLAMIDEALG